MAEAALARSPLGGILWRRWLLRSQALLLGNNAVGREERPYAAAPHLAVSDGRRCTRGNGAQDGLAPSEWV